MKAMTISHMPMFARTKELVEQGAIGKLKMAQVNFGNCKGYDATNRFFSPQLAGGALSGTGTYALSFVCWFLHAQSDAVLTNTISFETGVDKMSGIILRNSLDEMATATLTMRAKLPKVGIVAGEEGYLEIREYPRADSLQIHYTRDNWTETPGAGTRNDALVCELRGMEAAVSTTASNSTLKLSSDVVALMDKVRRQ